jgi:lipid-A-disaccharide synthase
MNKLVVKELIQNDFTVKNISDELFKLLNNQDYRNNIISNYNQLQIKLGGAGASKRIAETIVSDYKTAN